MPQNKIVWEPWVDPFYINKDEDEDDDTDDDIDTDDDDYKQYNEKKEPRRKSNMHGPVLIGSMGIIPINETSTPSKLYNFWMGHTNFSITKNIKNTLKEIEGVETLDIFTRYRMRVGIGKAFDTEVIKKSIESHLCQEKVIVTDKLGTFRSFLNQKYKNWLVGINDKGRKEIHSGEIKNLKELEKNYQEFYKSYE